MEEQANVPESLPTECRMLRPTDAEILGRFFERLQAEGIAKHFHPHPLTSAEAARRAAYTGKDVYCVLQVGGELVGYGMLRGWDEGYEIPSLGIAIDPAQQGRGHGQRLMEFLHATARQRGAKQVRLRVHPDNLRAVNLYQSLGYSFEGESGGQKIGRLELNSAAAPTRKTPQK